MDISNLSIYLIAFLDLAFIVAIIFLERKNPASSIAWILLLIMLPVVGMIIYMALGSGFHLTKKKRYKLKALNDNLNDNYIKKYLSIDDNDVLANHAYGKTANYLKAAGAVLNFHNQAKVFIDGESLFTHMLDDLRAAQKHIHLLYYIFRNDKLGARVLRILEEKAKEGVQVRLIYDSVGSMFTFGSMFNRLRDAGGESFAFEPFFSNLSSRFKVNFRNHRKMTIIDGHIGYMGGMNVGEEYLGRHKKLKPWRDAQLRLMGPAVGGLQKRFLMDWSYVTDQDFRRLQLQEFFPKPTLGGELAMQIISSGPDTAQLPIKGGLMSMLQMARQNIFIQTPYFTPDESFLDCIRIAALAGLDVRLMLPAVSDNEPVQQASLSYAHEVMRYGGKVYLYQGFMHAKAVVVDGQVASIGTCNIGERSFALNFEINAFIYNRGFATNYQAQFMEDQKRSLELSSSWFYERSLWAKAAARLARLASPLM